MTDDALPVDQSQHHLPRWFLGLVLFVSILPFLLLLLGIELGAASKADAATDPIHQPYLTMRGCLTHSLLEWVSVTLALVIALMAFLHYRAKGDLVAPMIGIALMGTALVDALHTLGADHLLFRVENHDAYQSFTWVVGRILNATILILGAALFIFTRDSKDTKARIRSVRIIQSFTFILVGAVFGLTFWAGSAAALPFGVDPGSWLARKGDLWPLGFYMLLALFLLPEFMKWQPSIFAHAVWISLVPLMVAELHMVFGAHELHNGHFNAAHGLKVVAYGVILTGALMDYYQTHAAQIKEARDRADEFFVREQTEETLNMERDILNTLMRHTNNAVCVKDASLRFTRVNRIEAELLGLGNPAEALGKKVEDFLDEESAREVAHLDNQVLKSEIEQENRSVVIRRDGQVTPVSISKYPLRNSANQVVGIVTITRLG